MISLFSGFLKTVSIYSAIFIISFSHIHLVVTAGVQNLIQDGSRGFLGSSGIMFIFNVIQASSRIV
jgi:hypothetical protein